MNKKDILKTIEDAVIFKKIDDEIDDKIEDKKINNVQWKFESCDKFSVLFFNLNEKNLDEFIEKTKKFSCGLIFVSENFNQLKSLNNIVVIETSKWMEVQKIICDQLIPFDFAKIKLVGITGTNGKTTTTDLIEQIARLQSLKTLTIGTLGIIKNGKKIIPESLTTPPYIEIRKIFFENAKDVDIVIMEVSSHALIQDRIYKFKFDAAAFTSFSQDHLDYHKSMDCYFRAKTLLVEQYLKPSARIFVPCYEEELFFKLKHFGQAKKTKSLLERHLVNLPLFFVSQFNKNNLELAWDIIEFLYKKNFSIDLKTLQMTDGRFSIFNIANKNIIIDFAHTPDALENILSTLKLTFVNSPLFVVFGCGGNRDKSKRKIMGEVSEKYANKIFVTSDNPRFEDPNSIIEDIVSGLTHSTHEKIVDRKLAIKKAFKELPMGGVMLIAGKGHEQYIQIKDEKIPYSDYDEIVKLKEDKS